MARLVLHIGTKKTGSTFIQALLAANRDRLASTGWSYPYFTQKQNHAEFALCFQPRITETHRHYGLGTQELIEAKRGELAAHLKRAVTKQSQWIISSEYLSTRLPTVDAVSQAVGFFREHFDQIRVVVALRRQEFVLPSVFSQKVKTGFPSEWTWEFCERQRPIIDCCALVERWAQVVGLDSIAAIPYLEDRTSDPGWLVDQFARASGIPIDATWKLPARGEANVSLSAEGVAYLQLFDPYLPRWRPDGTSNLTLRRRAVRRMVELTAGEAFSPGQADLDRIRDSYWDSNVALVSMMPPTVDWAAWLAQSALAEGNGIDPPEVTAARAVELMVAMSEPNGPVAWGYPGAHPPQRQRRGRRRIPFVRQ